jgi:hypothetical protein
MKCTYNITLRRVFATIVTEKNTKYSLLERVFLALDIEHAMLMDYIVIHGLSLSTEIFHINS